MTPGGLQLAEGKRASEQGQVTDSGEASTVCIGLREVLAKPWLLQTAPKTVENVRGCVAFVLCYIVLHLLSGLSEQCFDARNTQHYRPVFSSSVWNPYSPCYWLKGCVPLESTYWRCCSWWWSKVGLGEVIRCGNVDGVQLAKLVNNKRMYQRALSPNTAENMVCGYSGSEAQMPPG